MFNILKRTQNNKLFFCFLQNFLLFFLLLSPAIKNFLFSFFGFSIFFMTLLPFFPYHFMIFYIICSCVDVFPQFLSYKFCGKLWEYISLINLYFLYIPSLCLIILFFFFCLESSTTKDFIFSYLVEDKIHKNYDNFSDLLLQSFKKFSIEGKITSIEFCHCFTKYSISLKDKIHSIQFASLSKELSNIFDLNVLSFLEVEKLIVEIENRKKYDISLRSFKNKIEPNVILAMNFSRYYSINCLQNILMFIDYQALKSIIVSLLLTSDGKIIVVDQNLDIEPVNQLVNTLNYINLDEIIGEIEKRYKESINTNNKSKCDNLFLFMKINESMEHDMIFYIIKHGKKVNIFLYLYSQNFFEVCSFKGLFCNIISQKTEKQTLSLDLIGIKSAYFLSSDYVFKSHETYTRISFPKISTEDTCVLLRFLKISYYLFKPKI